MLDRRLYKIIEYALGETYANEYSNKFSTRIIVQKILYLLTHGTSNPKISLPYRWTFYLHGPYSSEIAHMLYHINQFQSELNNQPIKLEENDKLRIEHFLKFKQELDEKKTENRDFQKLTEEELYEILTTLTYAAGQIGNNKKELINMFTKFKPDLRKRISESVLNTIYTLLVNFSYI